MAGTRLVPREFIRPLTPADDDRRPPALLQPVDAAQLAEPVTGRLAVVAEQLPTGVTLVRIKGAINRTTAGDLVRQFFQAIRKYDFAPMRVLVDLAEVVFVDRVGLDALSSLQTRVNLVAGDFELSTSNSDVIRLLHEAAINGASWRGISD